VSVVVVVVINETVMLVMFLRGKMIGARPSVAVVCGSLSSLGP
jgi:hypothetical protein